MIAAAVANSLRTHLHGPVALVGKGEYCGGGRDECGCQDLLAECACLNHATFWSLAPNGRDSA